MESLKRLPRFVSLLAGLGVVIALVLVVPSLRGAMDRNRLSLQNLTLVQAVDWTDPLQVCAAVPPSAVRPAECPVDAACYAERVFAVRTGDWRAAQRVTTPADTLSILMQGWGAWCSGSPTDAVVDWQKTAKPIGLKFLLDAEQALVRGDLERSLEGVKIAHQIDPSSTTWLLIARLYIQLKNTPLALEASRGALSSGDVSAETYFQTGDLEWQLRELIPARSHLAKAVELAPNNSIYWHIYGSVLYQLGDLENAERAFVHATQLDPTYPHSFAGLAMAQIKQGKLDAAQDAIRNMLKTPTEDSTKANYLAEFARLAGEAKDFEQATALYAQAIALMPDNDGIWNGMLNLYARQGDCAGLTQVYERYAAYANSHQKKVPVMPPCSPKL